MIRRINDALLGAIACALLILLLSWSNSVDASMLDGWHPEPTTEEYC